MKGKPQYELQKNREQCNLPNFLQQPTTQFVSNDKSKSFYSSEIENNTLLDNNNLGFDEHSNSSNFFSNIDASNSQIQLDDSAIASYTMCGNFQAPDTAVKALY